MHSLSLRVAATFSARSVALALRTLLPHGFVLATVTASLVACDVSQDDSEEDGEDDAGMTGIEIAGQWTDQFGSSHSISDTAWTSSFGSASDTFTITQFDNTERFAVAQNAPTNQFNPQLWSKFNWAYDTQGNPYYCQAAFAANDEAAALASEDADPNSLAAGCAGFGWTQLIPS